MCRKALLSASIFGLLALLASTIALSGMTPEDPSRDPGAQTVAYSELQDIIDSISKQIRPGVETRHLEEEAESLLATAGLSGYFEGDNGFPSTIAVSINDEVVHGVPRDRRIVDGDLVTIELGVEFERGHALLITTHIAGSTDDSRKALLLESAHAALEAGKSTIANGAKVIDVSKAMDSTIRKYGFFPNRYYVGHQIGSEPVLPPSIPCRFDPSNPPQGTLQTGMALSLLAVVQETDSENHIAEDTWTVKTDDGAMAVAVSTLLLVQQDGATVLASPNRSVLLR